MSDSILSDRKPSGYARRPALVLCILIMLGWTAAAWQEQLSTWATAERFLEAAYPELKGRGLQIRVFVERLYDGLDFTRPSDIAILLREGPTSYPARPDDDQTPFLSVGLTFDASGRIRDFTAHGRYTHLEERQQFQQPAPTGKWTNDALWRVLQAKRARFGPDNREGFLIEARLRRFEPFLGTIKSSEVEFKTRARDNDESESFPLHWIVHLQTIGPEGELQCPTLWFEPYDGRLFMLHRSRCG